MVEDHVARRLWQGPCRADGMGVQSIQRFVEPDDIAALALYLTSDRAKSITGRTFPIDGRAGAAQ